MAAEDGSGGGSNDIIWISLIAIGLMVGAWFIFHTQISLASLYIIVYSLKAVGTVVPVANQYANILGHANPALFTFADIKQDYNVAGSYWMYVVIPLLVLLAFRVYTGSNIQKYTRVMNFEQLRVVQSENFPVILPAVRSRLQATTRKEGPWRWSQKPYEWALQNGVITPSPEKTADGNQLYYFDDRQAERALTAGWKLMNPDNLVESLSKMSPARRALAFAIARWCAGDFSDDAYATSGGNWLLAHLNKTFHYFEVVGDPLSVFLYGWLNMEIDMNSKNRDRLKKIADLVPLMHFEEKINPRCDFDFGGDSWPVLDENDKQFKGSPQERALRIKTWKVLQHFARMHPYEIPFLCGLIDRATKQETAQSTKDSIRGARTYMPLPTSAFLWLKVIDREAFYALNNMGRHAPFVESSGHLAHYRAEKKRKAPSERPLVFNAITALRRQLDDEEWLDTSTIGKR